MRALAWVGAFTLFVARWARGSLLRPPPAGRTLEEAWRIGVLSLPVLLTISIFVGTNLALQGYYAFQPVGGQHFVGMFVALAGIRELAPIIAAAMVAAKAGTEMASQIAVMKTRQQLDALEVMAVDPTWWLVTPRFYAILLVMPALTLIAVAVTILSSTLVAVFQLGLNGTEFLDLVRASTHLPDLVAGLVKGLLFGAVICLVSTFCGFSAPLGPKGVGQATNAAVVISSVVCVSLNFVVSQVLYG